MEKAIIQATAVKKTFRAGKVEVNALCGVDLTIPKGEMVAIMGSSGCGKTTLLNCLSGLDEIDAGEIAIEGTSLRQMNDKARTTYRAQRMGFIFQTFNLLPVISAVENVELPLLMSGVKPRMAREQALRVLKQVGLAERGHHRPMELSGGQRQRVTIARALVNEPAIVWADEPTGNLDSETSKDIFDLMLALNQEQKQTFVVVTHNPSISERCNRIVQMKDGQIVDDGNQS